MSFAALKKNRSSQFEALNNKLKNLEGGSFKDDRFWKLDVDKAGNGYAIIRFLPAPNGEDDPFVRIWDHGFQGPGGWYIENSLTTLGQDDPVSEYNSQLWNSGIESNKDIARNQKRRLGFYSNIYVVKDPSNPENEGKVFLFKFGKKIFDKLNTAMNPEFEDEEAFNPFDLWEGANFKLKARNGDGGFRSYDRSEFDSVSVVTTPDGKKMTDKQLEEMWNQCHSLKELIDPKNFKSYSELKARMTKVLGLNASENVSHREASASEEPMQEARPARQAEAPKAQESESPTFGDEDDDDDLSFFKQFADDAE